MRGVTGGTGVIGPTGREGGVGGEGGEEAGGEILADGPIRGSTRGPR